MRQEWGIFDQSGNSLFPPGTVVGSVEYQNDYRQSSYPQERGAFETYNKVKLPYQAKVTFFVGGSNNDRFAFLDILEVAVDSLDLFVVGAPDVSYGNASLYHLNYRREARGGVQLLRVDVWCEQVRVVATGDLSNTKSVNGAATQANGTVQTTPVTSGASGSTTFTGDPLSSPAVVGTAGPT